MSVFPTTAASLALSLGVVGNVGLLRAGLLGVQSVTGSVDSYGTVNLMLLLSWGFRLVGLSGGGGN